MNDTKFKWLIATAAITAIVIVSICKFAEIEKGYKHRKEPALGEYVYVDNCGLIHADRKCTRLNRGPLKSVRIERKQLNGFIQNQPAYREFTVCPKCVSDEDYKKISYDTNLLD